MLISSTARRPARPSEEDRCPRSAKRTESPRIIHNASYVILDGKLFEGDRLAEQTISVKGKQIDAWYSGKAHEPGGNIQALSAPDGFPLWVAEVEPGSTHDLTAARTHVLAALYWAAAQLDLPTLAAGGYEGAGSACSLRSSSQATAMWRSARQRPTRSAKPRSPRQRRPRSRAL
jgi:hypothetical protein